MTDAQIIKLGPRNDTRFAGGVISLLVAALGLLMVVGSLVGVSLIEGSESPVRTMYLFIVLFAALGSYVLYYAIRMAREQVFRGASIRIEQGTLTINDPRGMRDPVSMPLQNVRAFCVDSSKSRHVTGMFPLKRTSGWHGVVSPGATEHIRGYFNDIFDKHAPGLPMGTHDYNLLLVFEVPQIFDVNTRVDGERKKLDLKASVPAIAVRAQNHKVASEVLAQAGIRPYVTDTDAEELGPFELLERNAAGLDWSLTDSMGWKRRGEMVAPPSFAESEPPPEIEKQPELVVVPEEENFEFPKIEPLPSDEIGLSPAGIKRAYRNAVLAYYGYLASVFCLLLGGAYVLYFLLSGPPVIAGFLAIWAGTLAFYSVPRGGPDYEVNETTIDLQRNPRLLQMVEEQAQVIGVQPPSRVSSFMEINAAKMNFPFDRERSSAYSICLGITALAAMTESEARAMISHELGHAKINIGPEDKTSRAAMSAWQTAIVFSEHYLLGPITRFAWIRYLERVAKLSRESEYASDRIAANSVGPQEAANVLKRLEVASRVLPRYWSHYVVPALEAGYNPPIAEGFTRYLDDSGFGQSLRVFAEEMIVDLVSFDEYETHPDTTRRLDYINKLHSGAVQPGLSPIERSGATLLQDLRTLERDTLGLVVGPDAAMNLRTVDWPEATANAMPPHWRRVAAPHAETFEGHTFRSLADIAIGVQAWGVALKVPQGVSAPAHLAGLRDIPEDHHDSIVGFALYTTLASGLLASGGRLEGFMPGSKQRFSLNGREIEISEIMDHLIGEEPDAERWRAECAKLGIGEIRIDAANPVHSEDERAAASG